MVTNELLPIVAFKNRLYSSFKRLYNKHFESILFPYLQQPQCENPAGEYVDQNAVSTPPSAQYTTPQRPDPYPTPPAPFGTGAGKGSTVPRVNTDAAIGTAAGNGYEQQTLPGAQYKISENYLTSTPASNYQENGDSRGGGNNINSVYGSDQSGKTINNSKQTQVSPSNRGEFFRRGYCTTITDKYL